MDRFMLLTLLVVLAVAGVAYVFIQPLLSGGRQAQRRQKAVGTRVVAARTGERQLDAAQRRKQVTDSLKEIEQKAASRKATLEDRIAQAGLTWTRPKFTMISVALGALFGCAAFVVTESLIYTAPLAAIGGLGLPNWFVNFRRKRRIRQFINEFPNAIDVIVRGIKAGLPLGDCIRVIASEAAEPVRTEFRMIVETQSIGMALGEAIERLVTRVPVPETSFFSITISIQSKSGGNLSEALGNLSRVLRDRKKMRAKIKAVSAEAKASAGIIACLPLAVGGLVYVTAPAYIELLWLHPTGRMVMGVCAVWMCVGVAAMKKMVTFDM